MTKRAPKREQASSKEESKGDGMGKVAARLDPCVRCGARFCHAQYVSAAPGLCPGCSGIHRELQAQKRRIDEARKRAITSLLEEVEALDKTCVNTPDLRSAHKICKKCSAVYLYFLERVTLTDSEGSYAAWRLRPASDPMNADHCYACDSLSRLLVQFQQRKSASIRAATERASTERRPDLEDDIPF